MEKKPKKLKIDRGVLRQLRDAELGRVAGGLTNCDCSAAGITSCASVLYTKGCN